MIDEHITVRKTSGDSYLAGNRYEGGNIPQDTYFVEIGRNDLRFKSFPEALTHILREAKHNPLIFKNKPEMIGLNEDEERVIADISSLVVKSIMAQGDLRKSIARCLFEK